ncbi:MAG: FAD-binding oxidoreductase [Gemmatimonadaceae bacterium]|nr:FAD-binding oxidoreductase [Gemmatimonadaceae bacterium]
MSTIVRDPAVLEGYARDASGLKHVPEGLARPGSRDEVVALLRETAATGTAVTPAGAQTSTTGASIAREGILLSMRAMDRVLDVDVANRTARVEPGVLLGALNHQLHADGLFFAPDPTSDETCSLGGAIACNASGPRTLMYGATRAHVRALTVALADGSVREFSRSRVEKNTVGYMPTHDLVDWFVGSEGTLGVVVAAELALLPRPERETGLGIPFPGPGEAIAFARAARRSRKIVPRCLEYFDAEAFRIARGGGHGAATASGWGQDGQVMLYVEDCTDGDLEINEWLLLAETYGASDADVRVFEGEAAIREARRLRHAVPAAMHERTAKFLARGGRRISTDWAVPTEKVEQAILLANGFAVEAGHPPAVTYGHIGNGHPHQNWVAKDPDEVASLELVVERTLRAVIAMGGTVAAEHGIGKLKARWLGLQAGPEQVAIMRAAKREFDPAGRMAPGNILG